jgi:hypothetical protein
LFDFKRVCLTSKDSDVFRSAKFTERGPGISGAETVTFSSEKSYSRIYEQE